MRFVDVLAHYFVDQQAERLKKATNEKAQTKSNDVVVFCCFVFKVKNRLCESLSGRQQGGDDSKSGFIAFDVNFLFLFNLNDTFGRHFRMAIASTCVLVAFYFRRSQTYSNNFHTIPL